MSARVRTPMTLVAGALGSGKTTLLRHVLSATTERLAVIVNEFGELGVDGRVLKGDNIELTELDGGCVCCSLAGEFEAAVREIIDRTGPARIVVETTGVAEPDGLVADVIEGLQQTRLDGVVTLIDADALARFPEIGAVNRAQIEPADLLLINKRDRVDTGTLDEIERRVAGINPRASIVRTVHASLDTAVLFGRAPRGGHTPAGHDHGHTGAPDHGFQRFGYRSDRRLAREAFEPVIDSIDPNAIYRAKGTVRLDDGDYLLNLVAGRWELEPFPAHVTGLEFIGPRALAAAPGIRAGLDAAAR